MERFDTYLLYILNSISLHTAMPYNGRSLQCKFSGMYSVLYCIKCIYAVSDWYHSTSCFYNIINMCTEGAC